MIKKSALGVMIALTLSLGLVAAQSANACCAYNHTGGEIKFAWHLAPDWHVKSGHKKCDPGKGGKMDVVKVISDAPDIKICSDVPVAHHGWVSVYQNDNLFTVKSFNKDGTVKVTCTRTIDSESLKQK